MTGPSIEPDSSGIHPDRAVGGHRDPRRLLIALLLPAVQSVREAARRAFVKRSTAPSVFVALISPAGGEVMSADGY